MRRDGLYEFNQGDNPTSMTFGPDGRLYVGTYSGRIYALTLDGNQRVTGSQVFNAVHNLPTVNDDGSPAPSVVGRLVLGITFDLSATTPTMYVSHSDPRQLDCGIDTHSGSITRLVGPGFDDAGHLLTVVTGLPRSRRDHAVNGIRFGPSGWLSVAVGSNENLGAPSVYFGNLPQAFLSGSILSINVRSLSSTLDLRNVVTDADLPPEVQVFVSGLRNPYDFVWHSNGALYVNDNGSNQGFGTTPGLADGCPTGVSIDPPTQLDKLFRFTGPGAYAGSPNPARNRCVLDDGLLYNPPLPAAADYLRPIATYGGNGSSVDGITEYPGGAMATNLISATFAGDQQLRRVVLNSAGGVASASTVDGLGAFRNPLAVAAHSSGVLFVAEMALWSTGVPQLDAFYPQVAGHPALVTVSPTTAVFAKQQVGTTSAPQSITVKNTLSTNLTMGGASLSGSNSGAFMLGNTCAGQVLSPGATCVVTAAFTPGSVGTVTADLNIFDSAFDSPQKVPLAGTGGTVNLSLDRSTLNFGAVPLGSNGTQAVTLTNSGTADLHVSGVSVAGDAAADFAAVADTCTGATVGPQGTCRVDVRFTSSALGPRSASLSIAPDGPGGLVTAQLTGVGGQAFYFAEGFTGGFTENLDLIMPNQSGTARVDYYTPSGHTAAAVPLSAGMVASVDVNAAVGAYQQVSTLVTLPGPGVVERILHFKVGNWHGSTDIVGAPQAAPEWDFAEGSTLSAFDEFLTLENVNPTPVTATLSYFLDSGAHPVKILTLPASSRTTVEVFNGAPFDVSGCVPNSAGASCGVGRGVGGVAVKVTASQPVIVERPMYVNGLNFGSGPIRDGHVALGANGPGTQWSFSEGTTLAGFNEYLTLANPGAADARVSLSYQDDAGRQTSRSLVVRAHGRSTVEVFNPELGVGFGVGGVSVQVNSDQPIVAERPMYMYHDFGSGVVAGAHVVVGSRQLAQVYGFAAASTAAGESDYITIQNPNNLPANVTVGYYRGGAPLARPLQVPAHSRATVEVFAPSQGVGAGIPVLGVTVQSDQPLLVEKPTYSSNPATYGATDTIGYATTAF